MNNMGKTKTRRQKYHTSAVRLKQKEPKEEGAADVDMKLETLSEVSQHLQSVGRAFNVCASSTSQQAAESLFSFVVKLATFCLFCGNSEPSMGPQSLNQRPPGLTVRCNSVRPNE